MTTCSAPTEWTESPRAADRLRVDVVQILRPHPLRASLPSSLAHCLPCCLTASLTASPPSSLPALLPSFLPPFLPPCLTHCLHSCLPPFLPRFLPPCVALLRAVTCSGGQVCRRSAAARGAAMAAPRQFAVHDRGSPSRGEVPHRNTLSGTRRALYHCDW